MKRAIIYARVSTARQAEDGLPVESQLDQARQRAEQLGAEVLEVFVDEGISGRTAKRPAFQRAIAFCATHQVDLLITWSTSRFARNKLDAAAYKELLRRGGTRLVYVSCDIDSNTDAGWFSESIFEIVDEHYSRQIATDTLRSMRRAAADGYWTGGHPPFGYRPVKDGKRTRLAVIEAEAQIVREIYARALQGEGCKAIADQLNAAGRRRRKGTRWAKAAVAYVLQNHVYTGHIIFGRRPRAGGRPRPPSEWIACRSHPPLVSDHDWEAAQLAIGSRAPVVARSPGTSTWRLSGLIRCGACGGSMQIQTASGRSRTYSYYNCRAAMQGAGCEQRRIPAPQLETWIIDQILARLLTAERLVELISEVRELTSEWEADRQRRIDAMEAELREVRTRRERLFEILELQGINAPNLGDLTDRLRAHKGRIEQLERSLRDARAEVPPRAGVTAAEAQEAAEFLRTIVLEAEPAKARAFFGALIERIVINAGEVVIHYRPERIVSAPVHSRPLDWLPERGLLRTMTLCAELPDRWRRAA